MSPNDLATHNNTTFAKFKACLLIQITVKGYEQQKKLLLHLKEHEKISRLAV